MAKTGDDLALEQLEALLLESVAVKRTRAASGAHGRLCAQDLAGLRSVDVDDALYSQGVGVVAELIPHIGQLLRDAFRLFEDELAAGLAGAREQLGLRPVHDAVLAYLDADGTRGSVLAARARLSRQAITQLVDELEQMGVVVRHPDPEDGRAKIIRYTPAALEVFAASRDVLAAIEKRWATLLGPQRYAHLREDLATLLATNQAQPPTS